MASPLTSSHLPIPKRISWASCGIVPSDRGPILSNRQPFLLTMSMSSCKSEDTVRNWSLSMYPHDFTLYRGVRLPETRSRAVSSLAALDVQNGGFRRKDLFL